MNWPEGLPVSLASDDSEIMECYPVLAELRPHISRDEFLSRVHEQQEQGYHLAYLAANGLTSPSRPVQGIASVAGFRRILNLAWGRIFYVDDLITSAQFRSMGAGKTMLASLMEIARFNNCQQFHLDSGIQRKDAHRFYKREGLPITSYHFARPL